MKKSLISPFGGFAIFILAVLLSTACTPQPQPCESNTSCEAGKICKDKVCVVPAGETIITTDGGEKAPEKAPEKVVTENKEVIAEEKPKDDVSCPPGCNTCGASAKTPVKKDAGFGEYCEIRCGSNNCKQGNTCVPYDITQDDSVIQKGACYSTCTADTDCQTGQACSDHPKITGVKYCATLKKVGETCDHAKGEVCGVNAACLSDKEDPKKEDRERAGKCVSCLKGILECQKTGASFASQPVGGDCIKLDDSDKRGTCGSGLICIINSYSSNAPYSDNEGYCYKPCTLDSDCGNVQKCVSTSETKGEKVCGILNNDREECNYSQQKLCNTGFDCVVSNTSQTAGTCYRVCTDNNGCIAGRACQQWNDTVNNARTPPTQYCFDAVSPGPRCLGQACSTLQTSTNCLSGLTCKDLVCTKTCTRLSSDCQQDVDCRSTLCKDNVCKPKCSQHSDCGTGSSCSNSICYKNCAADTDCDYGNTCVNKLCTRDTTNTCQQDTDCLTANTKCKDNVCVPTCTQDSDCGTGNTCANNLCVKGCAADSDCDSRSTCVNKLCERNTTNTCQQDSDCKEPVAKKCSENVCTPVCTQDSDCSTGNACAKGVCTPKCTDNKGCSSGNSCVNNLCVRDCRQGEKCNIVFGQSSGLCEPAPLITKPGEKCSPVRRCDPAKQLRCLDFSSGYQEPRCTKLCDRSKGEFNNLDCPSDGTNQYVCRPATDGNYGVCQRIAKYGDSCYNGNVLSTSDQTKGICIRFSSSTAYFLRLCHPEKNVCSNGSKDLNPDCDGGKGRCSLLSSVVVGRDNVPYKGICMPYNPPTLAFGASCENPNDEDTQNAPGCKEGSRCVNLGGGAVCSKECEPCQSTYKDKDWRNPNCDNGNGICSSLFYSTGTYAFSICRDQGGAAKVLEEGDYCREDETKDCKEGLICILFSSDEKAKSICSKECDPSATNNEQCGGERCLALNSGGGICEAKRNKRRKIGETCLEDAGLDGFHDCLRTQDGKVLQCALPAQEGLKQICQVGCDAGKGQQNNQDCVDAGLTNHLCIPADTQNPFKGACLEKCSFLNEARCEASTCSVGECRESKVGNNTCSTQDEIDSCKKNGGLCKDKKCIITVCN